MIKVKRMQPLQIKTLASIFFIAFGTLSLLSIVCAYSSLVPAGETSYQYLWCGWASIIFAVCALLSSLLSTKGANYFCHSVTWGLILMGGVESIWGIQQIYGFSASNHYLYAVTGSFYNPGPYSGYLALVFPICLFEWLRLGAIKQRTCVECIGYYLSFGVLFLFICVLPAGMSRTAWLAAVFSSVFVCGMHYSWKSRWKKFWQAYRIKAIATLILLFISVIIGVIGIYHLKVDSAKGRLFMWKISSIAIVEKPFSGYGIGNFAHAYGRAQEEYFAKGDYDEIEERVAGSPEYAFNEYLQVAVECGIPTLLLILLVIGGCLYQGIKLQRIGLCGGFISLLIFSFSSYPMIYPCFLITFLFLLIGCTLRKSQKQMVIFAFLIGMAGVWLVRHNRYDACCDWLRCKMLYSIQEYDSTKKEYEKLYPLLKDRPRFLFEYGRCLHKLKEYEASNLILLEAEKISCDPMILNVIGENFQALKKYKEAEHWLLRSTHRLPGRIYPYYLLAKLYAEPDFLKPEKLKNMVKIVLTKEPKVQSIAIQEMREEVKKLMKQ